MNKAGRMFEYVMDYLSNASETVTVWLDILCVNQHEETVTHQRDVHPHSFSSVLKACSAGTVVVCDVQYDEYKKAISPASRAWCIFEWAHTLLLHGPDGLHLYLKPEDRTAVLHSINVTEAACYKPEDKVMILNEVSRHHTSPEVFNTKLKLQLLLEPLSYRADMQRLNKHAAAIGTQWVFDGLDAWLASESRVLCIAAGAGEGKSTISAALCSHQGQEGRGPAATVSACHFLKYNDQRRLEPIRIIKSLAFQLAERNQGVGQHLLQLLDDSKVVQMTDVEEAFVDLLLQPLQALGQWEPLVPLVLLIDALDEADPSELQLAISNGGKPTCPKACGNLALQLVTNQLHRLPPFVRFIFTTRPDAAAGQVLPCLVRTFPDSVLHLSPTAHQWVRSHLTEHSPWPSIQVAISARTPWAVDRTGASSSRQGGVLVYHTAVAACQGGDMLPPVPHDPQLEDVYAVYGRVFEAAYAQYGNGNHPGREKAQQLVGDLLAVLMAAKEPLSQSFLQQLCLGDAIPLLPGYPTLFLVDEHHLYLVHKSLGDWLLDPTISSDFAARVHHGHALIGLHLARLWRPQETATPSVSTSESHMQGTKLQQQEQQQVPRAASGSRAGFRNGNNSKQEHGQREYSMYGGSSFSPYLLKYMVAHLANAADAAAATAGGHSGGRDGSSAGAAPSTPAAVLDLLLQDFGFLAAALKAGHGPAIIGTLGYMKMHTGWSYEALRWLRSDLYNLVGKSAAELAERAVITVPVNTKMYQLVVSKACPPWRTRLVLPMMAGNWPICKAVLKDHTMEVSCVAFSPDSLQLASCGVDWTLRLWDTATGQCTATLEGHTMEVSGVVFSPDGLQLASSSKDRTLRLWDTATGQCTATLEGHTMEVSCVAFSPDGLQLVSSSKDRTLRLWDTATAQCTATMKGHTKMVNCVAFSPDGLQLASGSSDCTARLWDIATGQCTATLEGHLAEVSGVAFSPDGLQLASGSRDNTLRLWDTARGQCTATLEGHTADVTCVAFTPDGTQLASGSYDNTLRLWDTAATEQCVATLKSHTAEVSGVAFSPDGLQLASGSRRDCTLRLWDTVTGRCTVTSLKGHMDGWVIGVAFTPDGLQLASSSRDCTLRLWDTATEQCIANLKGHKQMVTSVAFSPDGLQLASGSEDCTVRLWDTAMAQCATTLKGHANAVYGVAFSPDGRQLASGSSDCTVRLWGTTTWQCTATLEGHTDWVVAVAFSPDGLQLASGSSDRTVQLWGTTTWQCTASLKGHTAGVSCVAFSPDGLQLASGSRDCAVRLWETATGQCTASLKGHTNVITGVAFSPDGLQVASSSSDCTLRLWDTATATLEAGEIK
ncbi:WD repeat domain-containing protein, partial [Tetrabaena socialis]